MSRPLKRSLSVDGHRTSISLETPFWDALNEIAAQRGMTMAALVQRIDRERTTGGGDGGLSTAIRIHVLAHFRDAVRRQLPEAPPISTCAGSP